MRSDALLLELSEAELSNLSGGFNLVDFTVATVGGIGLVAGGPVGIGIGLFCTAYAMTRAFD